MLKELMKCIREYKKPSILAPVLVSLEVVMECTIPFLIAMLVNQIKAAADRYGNFVTDVWYRSRKCLCNGILWICEKCTKRSVCKNTGIFI